MCIYLHPVVSVLVILSVVMLGSFLHLESQLMRMGLYMCVDFCLVMLSLFSSLCYVFIYGNLHYHPSCFILTTFIRPDFVAFHIFISFCVYIKSYLDKSHCLCRH